VGIGVGVGLGVGVGVGEGVGVGLGVGDGVGDGVRVFPPARMMYALPASLTPSTSAPRSPITTTSPLTASIRIV